MRRTLRLVKADRRGVAMIEFAFALPVVFIMMFGLADAVQLCRAHLRAQSAAIQIGQIISQCENVNASDEAIFKGLTERILDPYSTKKRPYTLQITAFGRDSANKDINWVISQSGPGAGQSALTFPSEGATVPPGYTMGKNLVLFRTEVVWSTDKTPLQRSLALLASSTKSSGAVSFGFMNAQGSSVFSTRLPNTDSLKAKGTKGCVS